MEILESRELLTINVVIDYSLDANNFLDSQAKKDLLQTAADAFGFGTAPSWQNQISGSNFTGPVSKAANGKVNVPLGDSGHWALSVTSGGELATMRPTLTQGGAAFYDGDRLRRVG